jgi:hypothetical protein
VHAKRLVFILELSPPLVAISTDMLTRTTNAYAAFFEDSEDSEDSEDPSV